MICLCGNQVAYQMRWTYEKGQLLQECDRCSQVQVSGVPDVYFRQPYYSEALDMEFTSKRQKANYLKAHGLSEAGDLKQGEKSWVEGTRAHRKAQFEKDRPMIRELYGRYLKNARHQ